MKTLLLTLSLFFVSLVSAQSKERISIHLFDLPENITLSEFKADLDKANAIYEKNGFGKTRYKIYQVASEDEANDYRYMWLSTWISDTEYETSHSDEMQEFWDNYFYPKYEAMLEKQLYRKYFYAN
jgi:hypothetical protein